ncbi:phosphoglycerate mutase-like protein [Xylona heveae TC161]|uniref:Phosphoglycerate mutase-like protein n=1 Tax=Xylona heveae (strain CBS 132557 / TC161) TaxID=1328760 RepID=A0A165HZH1_XYLHT|nr:phosphoglycerate mutase-like protein [Xylona heveae TC161]KZF24138.1 phosphoglycerate mutase-like protein [Xylona heveae TC161]
MVVEVIYVTRHGFRSNWVVNPKTGEYDNVIPSPTNIPSDPALAAYGVEQARQLADHVMTLSPPPERLYSSPFYRCLETLQPTVEKFAAAGRKVGEVRGENGIGEWYGTARFDHPSPANPPLLRTFFPTYALDYPPIIIPSSIGETIPELHDRVAYALDRMIAELDADESQPKAILLCTHAAPLLAIARALTGQMPEDISAQDFRPFTCSMSKFVRRRRPSQPLASPVARKTQIGDDGIPSVDWRGGKGVGGGWDCVVNGDCSFLENGEERGWYFSGDESFPTSPNQSGATLDAGTGLGVVVEGRGKAAL